MDSVGTGLGGKRLADIFRDMGIRQAGAFWSQKLFQSQFQKAKWVLESEGLLEVERAGTGSGERG